MIPKIIHYCWFGEKKLPESARKCIDSWKKFFPDYEIKEWNEKNYNVHKNVFISQAYEMKKYAFVSDYARFDILYSHGGIYFDTDVEVIAGFQDILKYGAYMGCEIDGGHWEKGIYVNPGLGMGIEAGHVFLKQILNKYDAMSFYKEDGSMNMRTVVENTTELLMENGLLNKKGIQEVFNIRIYPKEYFNPKDSRTGKINITDNTHSIHWYSMTWLSPWQKIRKKILSPFHKVFGPDCFKWLKERKQ